jgi:hypothetical protein
MVPWLTRFTEAEQMLIAPVRGHITTITLQYVGGKGETSKVMRGNIIHYSQNLQSVIGVLPWKMVDCIFIVLVSKKALR